MKKVRVIGGLGNQLFQLSFFLYLKKKYKNVKMDLSYFGSYLSHNGYELSRFFNVQDEWLIFDNKLYNKSRILRKMRDFIIRYSNRYVYEKYSSSKLSDYLLYEEKETIYFNGYWQYNYLVDEVIKDLLRLFKPIRFTSKFEIRNVKNREIMNAIMSTNSISIHIRGGDYLNDKNLQVCKSIYYENCFKYIERNIDYPNYFVFTDDLEYAKKLLYKRNKYNLISWNSGVDCIFDFHLMSMCKHNIIANSTFSWWAAKINKNSNKTVLSPNKWNLVDNKDILEILPEDWIRISVE